MHASLPVALPYIITTAIQPLSHPYPRLTAGFGRHVGWPVFHVILWNRLSSARQSVWVSTAHAELPGRQCGHDYRAGRYGAYTGAEQSITAGCRYAEMIRVDRSPLLCYVNDLMYRACCCCYTSPYPHCVPCGGSERISRSLHAGLLVRCEPDEHDTGYQRDEDRYAV